MTIADVLDRAEVITVFKHLRPKVTSPSAADKHAPTMRFHFGRASRVNIVGTFNATEAAKGGTPDG